MEEFKGGLILMATGMTVVFVFLVAMIGVMTLMSQIVTKLFPETEPAGNAVKAGKPARPTKGELAAITTALHQYLGGKK